MRVQGSTAGDGERPSNATRADLGVIVAAAAGGDEEAWNQLVGRFGRLVWSICHAYGLNATDAADVFQFTWIRLLENINTIRQPSALPGWLATTCRRECMTILRRARRYAPTGDADVLDHCLEPVPDVTVPVLAADRDAALWVAFAELTDLCQRILWMLVIDPETIPPRYGEVAKALGMPTGSLGPRRKRCLEELRKSLATSGIGGSAADS